MRTDSKETINLLQLKFFIEVAKYQNISKAAEHLYRTQSAVTRAIADLEKQLNVQLFERHHQGVILTEIGKFIYQQTHIVIEELQHIPEIVEKLRQDNSAFQPRDCYFLYNTRRLEIFSLLYLTQGMKNTASLLNITQPAVSSAIKLLENALHVELFSRTANGIQPTEICNKLYPLIKRALNVIHDLPDQTARFRGRIQGIVKIGALPLIRTHILPQAMVAVVEKYPDIQFVTFENAYESLVAQLRSGDIDFIIGALRPKQQSTDLQSIALFEENLCLVVRKQHRLLRKEFQLTDLLSYQWILPRVNSPTRILLERNFAALNLPAPLPTVETGDLALCRGLLLASDMIAVVSAQQMKYEIDQRMIKTLPIALPQTTRQIGLIYRKNSVHTAASQVVIDSLKNLFQ
ncbi:MAG: LysR family transcriptional regulator [Acinetobacter sp.]